MILTAHNRAQLPLACGECTLCAHSTFSRIAPKLVSALGRELRLVMLSIADDLSLLQVLLLKTPKQQLAQNYHLQKRVNSTGT